MARKEFVLIGLALQFSSMLPFAMYSGSDRWIGGFRGFGEVVPLLGSKLRFTGFKRRGAGVMSSEDVMMTA